MPINSPVFPVPGTPSTSSSNSTTPSFPQGTSLPPVEGLRKAHRTGSFESLESGRGSAGAQGIHNNGMQLPPPVPTYNTQVLQSPYSQSGPYEVKTEEDYHQRILVRMTSSSHAPLLSLPPLKSSFPTPSPSLSPPPSSSFSFI